MSLRVSTSGFYSSSLGALLDAQAALTRTQSQVASGLRIRTPADDPVGATRVQDLQRQIDAATQYASNGEAARARLSFEEQAFADATNALNRIRELVVQASNETIDDGSRAMIREEVNGNLQDLLDIANRKDAQGEYLFAGLATLTRPFERTAAGVVYRGDQGQRSQALSETQRVADGDSGFAAFMRIVEGNGTFVTDPSATNTGTGTINVGTVTDRTTWDGGTYTLQFTAANAWQVVDDASPVPNVVATGAYVPGQAIEFAGVSVAVAGAPAAGDAFTVRGSGNEGMFDALDALVGVLGASRGTPAERAQYTSRLAGSLEQLDRALDHTQAMRAGIGVRLNAVDTAADARDTLKIDLQSLLSDIQDLDYAEAVSRLNRQYVGLQAAQQTMARVGQMSLFDYL